MVAHVRLIESLPCGYEQFDLRIYVVLVASDDMDLPDAWLCHEGLARFATVPYSKPNSANIDKLSQHLTNYSLQKGSLAYDNDLHKQPLSKVLSELAAEGVIASQDSVYQELGRLAAHTLMVLSPALLNGRRAWARDTGQESKMPNCFQILGLDVLLVHDNPLALKPRVKASLLEVNSNPAMSITHQGKDSKTDLLVKSTVVRGALELVENWDDLVALRPSTVDGFSRIYHHGCWDTNSATHQKLPYDTPPDDLAAMESANVVMQARYLFEKFAGSPSVPAKVPLSRSTDHGTLERRHGPTGALASKTAKPVCGSAMGGTSPAQDSTKPKASSSVAGATKKIASKKRVEVPSYLQLVSSHVPRGCHDPAFALSFSQFSALVGSALRDLSSAEGHGGEVTSQYRFPPLESARVEACFDRALLHRKSRWDRKRSARLPPSARAELSLTFDEFLEALMKVAKVSAQTAIWLGNCHGQERGPPGHLHPPVLFRGLVCSAAAALGTKAAVLD